MKCKHKESCGYDICMDECCPEMENDLISRSAQHKHLLGTCVAKYPSSFTMGLLAAARELEAAPAVDAVEVVRCTECQYMEIKAGLCYCKVWQGYNGMGSEGFCSYEERKTE